jgi:hypothetical protein
MLSIHNRNQGPRTHVLHSMRVDSDHTTDLRDHHVSASKRESSRRRRGSPPAKTIRFPLPRIEEEPDENDIKIIQGNAWLDLPLIHSPTSLKGTAGSMINARCPRSPRREKVAIAVVGEQH